MGGIYLPREDSYLIQKHVKAHVKGKVLDMGTGSGILAKTALEHTEDVIACDVDKTAVKFATEQGVNVIHSDLFSNLAIKTDKDRFSLIMFNPPYLPNEPGAKDVALDGGKNGYETIGRFLDSANPFLHENGKILLLFSSLTKKQKIDEYIERNCFSSKLIDREKLAFEELYVYSIEKTKLLKKLERIGIKNISYFTKGHRGYLYKGLLKNKEVMIKAK